MLRLTDTHAHFYFSDFAQDQAEAIARARQSGVEWIINVGTNAETSKASLELAEKYHFIWAAAGIHPNDACQGSTENFQKITELLKHPRMVAIGEIGLDFFRDHTPREVQIKLMYQFLELYRQVKKPLIIHCRDAYQELFEIFSAADLAPYRGVMHCFSSNQEDMEKFLRLGFHISFAGPLTYKKNDDLRAACKACPQDRLLFETDAPFLPPQSLRGKRNESSFMLETARVAAELHGISLEQLADLTTQNAGTLFGLC